MITLPTIGPDQNIAQFISNIYTFSIGIVGVAVFIQFLRAGFLYFGAAGNAAETSHGKTMMGNAILGTILLFSAFMILNFINPDLTKPKFVLPSLPPVAPGQVVNNASLPLHNLPPVKTREVAGQDGKSGGAVAKARLGSQGVTTGATNLDGITNFSVIEIIEFKHMCGVETGSSCSVEVVGFNNANGRDSVKIKNDDDIFEFMRETYSDSLPFFSTGTFRRDGDNWYRDNSDDSQLYYLKNINDLETGKASVVINGQDYTYSQQENVWIANYRVERLN